MVGMLLLLNRKKFLFRILPMTLGVLTASFFIFDEVTYILTRSIKFFYESLINIGDEAHRIGVISFYTSLLSPDKWCGSGTGIFPIKVMGIESGWGWIYSQFGIIGLLLLVGALVHLLKVAIISKNLEGFEKRFIICTVLSIFIILNFNYYIGSFKNFGFVFFTNGYFYCKALRRRSKNIY
jgi:hypothetical protein